MKKLLFFLILILCVSSLFAKEYTLKNNQISIKINCDKDYFYISQIKDLKKNIEFIDQGENIPSIWSFKIKKDKDFNGEEITLNPNMAKSFVPTVTATSGKFIWKNITCQGVEGSYFVEVSVNLKDNNSYWNINIINKSSSHGIWNVDFPKVANIDVHKGNEVFYPICGGILDNNFEKGAFNQQYPYYGCAMQFISVTKNNSSLYLCTEDLKGKHKRYDCSTPNLGEMTFNITNYPAYMSMVGHDYKQEYNFNIAVIDGDNYDVCKKYRKWGIENKFVPFAMGSFAERKDVPSWWKDSCVWLCCDMYDKKDYSTDWTIEATKFLDMPVSIHLYQWSEYIYDTHYPNMLPARGNIKTDLPRLCENNVIIMPYTNGHIVDRAGSDYYTQYGDDLLLIRQDGSFFKSDYQSVNTENMESCPASPYEDCYHKEAINVINALNADALYIDQLGSKPAELCFSDEHRHAPGGGDFWCQTYLNLLNKIRTDINSQRKEPIIMTTECSAEMVPVDAWLACAEWGDGLTDTNSQMYVFSGYRGKFGVIIDEEEMKRDNSLPAINKNVVALCKGYQLGWQLTNEGSGGNMVLKYPKFGAHLKDAAHGRYAAKEYFNLGEMVRPVKFTNNIPTRDIYWKFFGEEKTRPYPTVRTCSYFYKGKTMVCLASVNPDNDTEVSFEAEPSDLYLENKDTYTISEIYPNNKEINSGSKILGTVTLKPLEIKILIIE